MLTNVPIFHKEWVNTALQGADANSILFHVIFNHGLGAQVKGHCF
jgi:hypothetical protein